MQIRLPRGRQRNLHLVGDRRSHRSHVARPGNLHHVRTKVAQQRLQPSVMPQKKQVIVVGPVERKFHRSPPQLYAGDRSFSADFIVRAGVHHEKWNLVAPGECLKVPAGLCHAVHFVIAAGKKRDPWTIFLHDSASEETASGETISSAIGSCRISAGRLVIEACRNTHPSVRCTVLCSTMRIHDKYFLHVRRWRLPQRGNRTVRTAICVRMENAIIPPS